MQDNKSETITQPQKLDSKKMRIDVALFENDFAQSREKAARLVLAGAVYFGGQKVAKPSFMILRNEISKIETKKKPFEYVSRGGLKLEKAFKVFDIDVSDKICVDVGASTGGFTHCMLLKGAKKVFAIDVGYNQLDWRMRSDERVVTLERSNARNISKEWFGDEQTPQIEFGSMDVSFISIKLILFPLIKCLKKGADFVALIKPQFEAGRQSVGKKGVVRDSKVHVEVIVQILSFVRQIGYCVCGLDFSPITGPEGNIEFLLWLKNCDETPSTWEQDFDEQYAQNVAKGAKKFHEKTT